MENPIYPESRRSRRRHLLLVLALLLALYAGSRFQAWLDAPLIGLCVAPTISVDDRPVLCFSDKPENCPRPKPAPSTRPNAHGPVKPLGPGSRHFDPVRDECRRGFPNTNVCQKYT